MFKVYQGIQAIECKSLAEALTVVLLVLPNGYIVCPDSSHYYPHIDEETGCVVSGKNRRGHLAV